MIFSILLLVFTGFGMMMQMASTNTLLQTLVDDDKRGRVMSLYVMAFMGTAPFGSFMAGTLASTIGAPYTVLSSGVICLIGAIIFYKICLNSENTSDPSTLRRELFQKFQKACSLQPT